MKPVNVLWPESESIFFPWADTDHEIDPNILSTEFAPPPSPLSLGEYWMPTCEYDGYIFTDSDQVPVPVWNIFVRYTGGDVEHNNSTLALEEINVVNLKQIFFCCSRFRYASLDMTNI